MWFSLGCLETCQARTTSLKGRAQLEWHTSCAIFKALVGAFLWMCIPEASVCVLKLGDPPLLGRVATPDLCLCHPLICAPPPPSQLASHHNPFSSNLRWQVDVSLGCPWPLLHSGLAWDWIRPDQTPHPSPSVLSCISEAEREDFLKDF